LLSLSLDEKIAVVTGASRGLGQAAALALAEGGADIALLGRAEGELEKTADMVRELKRRAIVVKFDATAEDSIEAAAEAVVEKFGRVDVLVNNAGVAETAPLLEMSLAQIRRVIDTNLVGAMLVARAFGAHMVAQQRGSIINVASVAGLGGEPDLTAYCASKGGLISFTKALAIEWARHNVTVNALAPGWFRTDLNKTALDDPKIGPKIVGRIPLRRVGQPEELGPLVVYLASDSARFMTGSVVVFDGGQSAR
jgi:2-deoxy-D-gluconate 3-dehydrogenase